MPRSLLTQRAQNERFVLMLAHFLFLFFFPSAVPLSPPFFQIKTKTKKTRKQKMPRSFLELGQSMTMRYLNIAATSTAQCIVKSRDSYIYD